MVAYEQGQCPQAFQSALPRGERHCIDPGSFMRFYFNPRSREGSDTGATGPQGPQGISIRAPARGATSTVWYGVIDLYISIRAPARGATGRRQERN